MNIKAIHFSVIIILVISGKFSSRSNRFSSYNINIFTTAVIITTAISLTLLFFTLYVNRAPKALVAINDKRNIIANTTIELAATTVHISVGILLRILL